MMNKAPLLLSALALTLLASPARSHGQAAAAVTTLHSFTGADTVIPNALVQGRDGNFYGTTVGGGSANNGTVFKVTTAGVFTTLHNFSAVNSNQQNADGERPSALVQGSDGDFYGTTPFGGSAASGQGTVFKITPAGALTTLHNFTFTGTDGGGPEAGLVQGSDGNFYGTTSEGGSSANNDGTFFKITPAGVLTTVANGNDAENTNALIQSSDGNFYGTTSGGGAEGYGTVFQRMPTGQLTVLHNFIAGTDGEFPEGALVKGSDGSFYGTTVGFSGEQIGHYGTVFKITSAGVFTLLHHFTGNDTDGAGPDAPLVLGKDGNFYGTTVDGGSDDFGTVFQMTPAGVTTTVYSFTGLGADGAYPMAGLVQGTDGSFYGTTQYGGSSDAGAIFKLTMPPPAITSPATAAGTEGKAFSYQITATGDPTSYGVGGLFKGLSVNAQTGLITGTPTATGTHTLTLRAANSFGTGSKTLTLTVNASTSVITSAETATAKAGEAFSYQITATGNPTRYGVSGLFEGMTVNQQTGLISGTPTGAGTHTLTLRAANAGGTGTRTLTLTVAAP